MIERRSHLKIVGGRERRDPAPGAPQGEHLPPEGPPESVAIPKPDLSPSYHDAEDERQRIEEAALAEHDAEVEGWA